MAMLGLFNPTGDASATPDSVAYRRRLAAQLGQQATDSSPKGHWAHILAQALQGGVSGYQQAGAQADEAAGRKSAAAAFEDGKTPGMGELMNPWVPSGMASAAFTHKLGAGDRAADRALRERGVAVSEADSASRIRLANEESVRKADLHPFAVTAGREGTIAGGVGARAAVAPTIGIPTTDPRFPSYAATGALPAAPETTYASAFDKEAAKKAADELAEADKAGAAAGTLIGSIRTMTPLVDRAFTGTGSSVKVMAAKFAAMLGVNPESIRSATSATELLNSGMTQLTIGMAAPLKPVSNTDMMIIEKAAGSATLSPDGLKDVLGATEAVARRAQIYNQLLRQALNSPSRGRDVDRTALAEEALRRVPAYTPRSGYGPDSRPAVEPPRVGEVRDGYSFRGGDPSSPASWVKVGGR